MIYNLDKNPGIRDKKFQENDVLIIDGDVIQITAMDRFEYYCLDEDLVEYYIDKNIIKYYESKST